MIEVNWGETITLYTPKYKKIEHFRTIEKAQYWLRCKWPEMTTQRSEALLKTQLAIDCLIPVGRSKKRLHYCGTCGRLQYAQCHLDVRNSE